MAELILYDIPSKHPRSCWTPNPWKARLCLNFKGLDYKTEWLEYPEIAPVLKAQGVNPNLEGIPYTCAAVKFPSGGDNNGPVVIMDSMNIARELELRYPSTPSLHLDSPIIGEVAALMGDVFKHLAAVLFPAVTRQLLSEPSAEYFDRTRSQMFGVESLEQLEQLKGGPQAWENAKETMENLAKTLKKDESGPFFLGKEASFADFILVGMLELCHKLSLDYYEKWTAVDPAFNELYEACGKWLERCN